MDKLSKKFTDVVLIDWVKWSSEAQIYLNLLERTACL